VKQALGSQGPRADFHAGSGDEIEFDVEADDRALSAQFAGKCISRGLVAFNEVVVAVADVSHLPEQFGLNVLPVSESAEREFFNGTADYADDLVGVGEASSGSAVGQNDHMRVGANFPGEGEGCEASAAEVSTATSGESSQR
jgi:hypothetical protein